MPPIVPSAAAVCQFHRLGACSPSVAGAGSREAVAAARRGLDPGRAGPAGRYDDESIVHDRWIRQRYDGGYAVSFVPARTAAVVTAWHEAGHAVAALAVGTDFSSASIYHARDSAGRVHGIRGAGELAFVIDAAGQIAELLRDWTLPGSDDELRAWLAGWKSDGGDARR